MFSTARLLAVATLVCAANSVTFVAAANVTEVDLVCDLQSTYPSEAKLCDADCSCVDGDSDVYCKEGYDQCHLAACSCKPVVVPKYNLVCATPGKDQKLCAERCGCGHDGTNYCYTTSDDERCARAGCSCKL